MYFSVQCTNRYDEALSEKTKVSQSVDFVADLNIICKKSMCFCLLIDFKKRDMFS